MFDVQESDINLMNKRNEDDAKVFIEICQNEVKTNIGSNDISKICRLRRKKEDETPRPILVSMSSQYVKKRIMRNLHNLRSSDSNISMNHDMTKTEREDTKHLIDIAREINKQEHIWEWFYKVRGPPWEKKILRIRKLNLQ